MLSFSRFQNLKNSNKKKSLLKKITKLFSNSNVSSMFNYRLAIFRKIDPKLVNEALRQEKESIPVNLELANEQHKTIMKAFTTAINKTELLPSNGFPDSVFTEDTSIIIGNKALICNIGAQSRKGEVVEIKNCLKKLDNLEINDTLEFDISKNKDATIDAGDVLFTGREIFVGLSSRTNNSGLMVIKKYFPQFKVTAINVTGNLHLKTACSMAGEDLILVGGDLGKHISKVISETSPNVYKLVHLPDTVAANCIYANGVLFHRSKLEFPKSVEIIEKLPGKKVSLYCSEFAKCDGAVSSSILLVPNFNKI